MKRAQYKWGGGVIAQREMVGSDTIGTMTYLHSDHLGSVSVATNGTGGYVDASKPQQAYDPWGKVRLGSIGQTTLNYTGQKLDGTGLLFYNARYYDPSLGKFVSADTIAPNSSPQSLNRYSYVRNNPIYLKDPTGHCDSESSDPNNDTCWQKYSQVTGKLGFNPDGLNEWKEDRLSALEWWLDRGVKFTSADKNFSWNAEGIGVVLNGLEMTKNYLTSIGVSTEAKLGIGLNKSDALIFELVDLDTVDPSCQCGGRLEGSNKILLNTSLYSSSASTASGAGTATEKTYTIIHELGHHIDRVGNMYSDDFVWTQIHRKSPPSDKAAVNKHEDFAETFLWLVVNQATNQSSFSYYGNTVNEPNGARQWAIVCYFLQSPNSPIC